jgi:hypothetical protein
LILPEFPDDTMHMAEQPNSPTHAPSPSAPRQPFTPPTVEDAGRLAEITLQFSGGGPLITDRRL